eukprot:353991-Chlamydomonas_euryale.AAC.5
MRNARTVIGSGVIAMPLSRNFTSTLTRKLGESRLRAGWFWMRNCEPERCGPGREGRRRAPCPSAVRPVAAPVGRWSRAAACDAIEPRIHRGMCARTCPPCPRPLVRASARQHIHPAPRTPPAIAAASWISTRAPRRSEAGGLAAGAAGRVRGGACWSGAAGIPLLRFQASYRRRRHGSGSMPGPGCLPLGNTRSQVTIARDSQRNFLGMPRPMPVRSGAPVACARLIPALLTALSLRVMTSRFFSEAGSCQASSACASADRK